MSNTITAFFKGRIGVAEAVYQNDYGIIMNFDSIELPAHFDCYFSVIGEDEAIPGVGADRQVVIPNTCLAKAGNVTLHIPFHTGANDSEVEYVVYFKVIGRARPIDDGTPTQMTAIERALALLSQPITNIKEIVNEALSFTGDTFDEMQEQLDADQAAYESSMNSRATAFEAEIRSDIADVKHDFDVLNGQYQTAVSALTVDSEVQNVRVGDDGVTYASAGEAVRTQFSNLKSDLSQLTEVTTTFVDGYISSGDGSLRPATSDAQKTSDFISVLNGLTIDINLTFTANRYKYVSIYGYDASKKYVGFVGGVNGGQAKNFSVSATIANESIRYVRFSFTTYGDTYTCLVNTYINIKDSVVDMHVDMQNNIKKFPLSCLNIRDTIEWQKGDINSSGKVVASTTRIVTTDVVCKPYDIVLPFNSDVFYMMWKYDDIEGTNPTWVGYVNMHNYAIYRIPYIIPANTYFRLIIRYTDTTITETDIKGSDIYNTVEMYEYNSYKAIAKSLRNNNVMSIAHQGMGTNPDDKGQSRMSALVRACDFGFSHIETDIQWSSDNVPVCCHDATFTDTNTSNTITIADHTLQELKTYGYYDETILSLEEVIAFCKENGMGLVIDHGYIFTNAQWSIAFALVNKYVMQDHVIWLVTAGTETGTFPNEWYSKAHIAVLSNSNDLTADIEYAQSIKTNFNHVYIDVNANVMTPTILANAIASLGADIKLIIWTIDRTDWLASFKPYVAGITSNTINCGLA